MHNDCNSRDKNCELQESVNQQKVECSSNDEGYNNVFQACAMVSRCPVLVQRLSRSVVLTSACSARWRCCLPFFLTYCGVMSCAFALSVVGSRATDFATSHAWLKSKVIRTASPTVLVLEWCVSVVAGGAGLDLKTV